jgi:hypothetical protein
MVCNTYFNIQKQSDADVLNFQAIFRYYFGYSLGYISKIWVTLLSLLVRIFGAFCKKFSTYKRNTIS